MADANGNLTTYGYDGHGQLSETHFPSETTAGVSSATDFEEFRYDAAGKLTAERTRKGDWILSAFDDLAQYVRKAPQSAPAPLAWLTTFLLCWHNRQHEGRITPARPLRVR